MNARDYSCGEVPLSEVPRQRGSRVSIVDGIVQRVIALPAGRAFYQRTRSLDESRRLGARVRRVLSDRGYGSRYRTMPDAVFFWLDRTLDAAAMRGRLRVRKPLPATKEIA